MAADYIIKSTLGAAQYLAPSYVQDSARAAQGQAQNPQLDQYVRLPGFGGISYATTASAASVGLPSDVSLALASIPIAQDGMVITADFHNTLRAALVAIASFLGDAAVNHSVALTLAPTFLPFADQSTWAVSPEGATGSDGSHGWMPIELPDGSQLRALAVVSTPQSGLKTLDVQLSRVPLAGGGLTDLFKVSRTSGNGNVSTDSAALAVSGITSAAALDDFRRVDNSSYRYLVRAQTSGSGKHVDIHSLQVGYTRW